MSKEVIMPQMGESVAEGTILKWLVEEGQKVDKDQPLVEISTDKVDTEVPSPVEGVLTKIVHHVDETVPVGTVIAVIEEGAELHEIPKPEVTETHKPRLEEKIGTEEKLVVEKRYSPLVRRLAREYGIALEKIKGTGLSGRVTKEDVLEYIESIKKVTVSIRHETKEPGIPQKVAGIEKPTEELIPLSPKRKIIAERMAQSKRTAPHVTTTFEIDMTKVARYRDANKDAIMKTHGVHLTYLPFIIAAAASALKEYPIINSSWSDEGIILKRYINIGIAVSVDDGLIVPVIKDADRKGIIELGRESQDLAKRAKEKRLKVDEVQGGTFTITNYGINGSLFGTPIILQPQIAILGIGTITKRTVVIDDTIAIRNMSYFSLSFDHRVIDGAQADQFVLKIKTILEGWEAKVENVSVAQTGFGGVW